MCPPEMDIAVERDQTTGELLAYHEVRMHTCIYLICRIFVLGLRLYVDVHGYCVGSARGLKVPLLGM